MRVLTYNVLHGGAGREADVARVVAGVAPDVVCLQEAGGEALLRTLAGDGFHVATAPAADGADLAILTRERPARTTAVPLDPVRSALLVELAAPALRVGCLHLQHAPTDAAEAQRMGQWLRLAAALAALPAMPTVLGGDFNTTAPGQPVDLAMLRDKDRAALGGARDVPRAVMAHVLAAGWHDCAAAAGGPGAPAPTLPAARPALRYDYLLADDAALARLSRAWVVDGEGPRAASDHLPVAAEFDP